MPKTKHGHPKKPSGSSGALPCIPIPLSGSPPYSHPLYFLPTFPYPFTSSPHSLTLLLSSPHSLILLLSSPCFRLLPAPHASKTPVRPEAYQGLLSRSNLHGLRWLILQFHAEVFPYPIFSIFTDTGVPSFSSTLRLSFPPRFVFMVPASAPSTYTLYSA